ncbi:hypothetical protein BGX38DRAFT_1266996 [Terfezia claveryi]|nr:hypothetical protein BGX38DRAFT_1266996 [Terfezia claveryi]
MSSTAGPPTSTSPSFNVQGLHHPTTNPLAISRRANIGFYPLNGLYAQQPRPNLGAFQRARPELAPQERQYILHARNRGDMDALVKQHFDGSIFCASQQDGKLPAARPCLGEKPSNEETALGTTPFPLAENSIDPSTIPEHLGQLFTGTTDFMYQQSFQTHHDPSITHATVNNAMCLVPTLSSSFPPHGLPIQQISAPGSIPSALVGYLSQTFRDDPFSSVRGSAFPPNDDEGAIGNISIQGVSGNIGASGLGLSQAGLSTQYSHFPLDFPYTFDMNGAAFTAPRMEAQPSTSTYFDSASTNADLESGDELLISEMDIRREMNQELHSELAGLISTSQLTVRDDHTVSTLPIHLSPFNSSAGAFDFTKQTIVGGFEQSLPTDLHLLPELTDTVGTPSSPAQMSRQPSCTTNSANKFNNFGALPQAPVPMDAITAPEMGREWSDLSNPAIPTFIVGCAPPSDGQYQRKRLRQPPPEDIDLLLKGAGVATAAPANYGQDVDVPGTGALHGLASQLSYDTSRATTLEHFGRDFGGESGTDEGICTYNPAKLRRVDGQDVCDARAHSKSVELEGLKSSPNVPSFILSTTHPLPTFDQDMAMRRERGAPPNVTQPFTGNTQPVMTATTTTQNVTRPRPVQEQSLGNPRPRASLGPISMNSQISSRSYVRRPHPRAYCDQCNEVRDGFRGDHELRRHKERVHAVNKKVWVTKDISPEGDFLAGCKACKRGKHYFADYNAAAHLRRQHFCKEGRRGRLRRERDEKREHSVEKIQSKLRRRWMQQIEIPQQVGKAKGTIEGSLPDEDDENQENGEVKEKDLESKGYPGKDDNKGVFSRSTGLADNDKNRSPAGSSTSSNTLQPETQIQHIPFQPFPLREQIDDVPSADLHSNFIQSQIHRQLQELLEPAMDKVDLSLESFYRLQNGLG